MISEIVIIYSQIIYKEEVVNLNREVKLIEKRKIDI